MRFFFFFSFPKNQCLSNCTEARLGFSAVFDSLMLSCTTRANVKCEFQCVFCRASTRSERISSVSFQLERFFSSWKQINRPSSYLNIERNYHFFLVGRATPSAMPFQPSSHPGSSLVWGGAIEQVLLCGQDRAGAAEMEGCPQQGRVTALVSTAGINQSINQSLPLQKPQTPAQFVMFP